MVHSQRFTCRKSLPIFLSTFFLTFFAFSMSCSALAATVEISFEHSESPNVSGYTVHYGKQSRDYVQSIDIGTESKCRISDLKTESLYYFAVTAYTELGYQSDYSAELATYIPSSDPPQNTDSDNDGLTDSEESTYGTNPDQADSDGDGLGDKTEVDFWGDDWDRDADGDGLINLLDPDSDDDGILDGEEVENGSDPAQADRRAFVFEAGEIVLNHSWTGVPFNQSFVNPVVVAKTMSSNGWQPGVIRVRNVTSQGFEIRIQEWDYLDGPHAQEAVSYMVMEAGHFQLPDGTNVEAGRFETNKGAEVHFQQRFGTTPVVTSSVTTENGPQAVTGRLFNIDAQGFSYHLQEQEASNQDHALETASYIAWEPSTGEVNGLSYEVGRTENVVTDLPEYIGFGVPFNSSPACLADMQTKDGGDTATVRSLHKDEEGIALSISEEASLDTETSHTTEVVGFMAFESLSSQDVGADPDPAQDAGQTFTFEVGEIVLNHSWRGVAFKQTFLNPVVVAKPMSSVGWQPGVIRIRNVTGEGFEVRIQEWDYLDGRHAQETVTYMVMEAGHFQLADGTHVEAGCFNTHRSAEVNFKQRFGTAPVVTSSVTTENGPQAVTGRLSNIDTQGFSCHLQEQEASDQSHAQEGMSYIAWEPSAGELNGVSYEVGRTENVVTDLPEYISFEGLFNSTPACLADMQTKNGADTATVRYTFKDEYGIELAIAEEASRDEETFHVSEIVGFMAFLPHK